MDDYLKQQALDKLQQAQNITVAVKKTADFDAFASGLALFLSLAKTGKSVTILAKTPTVADAQSLYGVNNIGKTQDNKNLVISISEAVKNVDKVTYFLDGDKLKVVVHAFPNSAGVNEKDLSFERTSSKPDLILAIAHNSADELKTDITHEQQISSDQFIISINKDKTVQEFAQINVHGESSYSELVTNLLQAFTLPIDQDAAFNLYAALASATKMFSPSHVKQSTFEIAQQLIKLGAGNASFAAPRPPQPKATPSVVNTFDIDLPTNIPPVLSTDEAQTPIENVEVEKQNQDWLKPPKIYRGSKSFDSES